MTLHIVPFDVIKVRRGLESRMIPVKRLEPLVDRGITTSDISYVALEVLYVDWVESDDRDKEANIDFGQLRAKVEWTASGGQMLFGFVQVLEKS